jgi:hypothetical protein
VVGGVTIAYEGLEMAAEPGLTLTIYSAEPGSPSAERLQLLASWAASHRAELGLAHADQDDTATVEHLSDRP